MDTVSAAAGDASQLLHVEVQQIAGSRVLVAHRRAADAMEPVEAVEPEAPEDCVDGGAGEAERPRDAMWPEALAAAHGANNALQLGRDAPGVAMGRRAAVLEAGGSHRAVAAHPLRNRGAGDSEAPGDFSLGPPGFDLVHQLQPGDRCQTRVTMCDRGFLSTACALTSHGSRRSPPTRGDASGAGARRVDRGALSGSGGGRSVNAIRTTPRHTCPRPSSHHDRLPRPWRLLPPLIVRGQARPSARRVLRSPWP